MKVSSRWAALVAAAVPIVLVGCSAISDDATPSEQDFRDCMAAKGFAVEEVGFPPRGEPVPSDSVWATREYRSALEGCITESGIGEVARDDPALIAQANLKAVALVSCMRENGWDYPDAFTPPGSDRVIAPPPSQPNDPEEAQAVNQDFVDCATEVGIPVEGWPEVEATHSD